MAKSVPSPGTERSYIKQENGRTGMASEKLMSQEHIRSSGKH